MFGTQTQKQLNGDGRRTRWEGIETSFSRKKSEKQKHVEEMQSAGFDPIACRLCDFTNMISITTHVTRKHKLGTQEYLARFPESKLYQTVPSVAKATAEKLKQRHAADPEFHQKIVDALSPLPSKIEFWTSRGFSEEEAKTKLSSRQKAVALLGGEEKFRKQSQATSGDCNPMSLASIARRHGISKTEASRLTPCYGRIKENHPMWGKNHTPESLEKIANAPHLRHPSKRSLAEIQILEWCKQNFTCEVDNNIGIDRWNVDILLKEKKLVIEFFGDFWHMRPGIFDDCYVNPITKITAKEKQDIDNQKIEYLTALGYNVIVVWESDWKANPEREKERIVNAYNRTL
jgi:G:T-mismatch repair DNA endonuclease (very short patch repair protein)